MFENYYFFSPLRSESIREKSAEVCDELNSSIFNPFFGIFLVVKIYFNAKLWNIHQLCDLQIFIEKEINPIGKEEKKMAKAEISVAT